MKTKINAKVVADSLSIKGDRITTLLITFPRFILAEVNTHRMLTKNTSSSRAIPLKKMIEVINDDPFIPIAWQKAHKGMQGTKYIKDESSIKQRIDQWLEARNYATSFASKLGLETLSIGQQDNDCITKQLCNRLLEPFMWTTMLITGSEEGWKNFFKLRCPQYELEGKTFKSWDEYLDYRFNLGNSRDVIDALEMYSYLERAKHNKGQAEIHMMQLAECIYDAYNESKPKQLEEFEWHIPFEDYIDEKYDLEKYVLNNESYAFGFEKQVIIETKVKISVAMAAHTSYTVVGNNKEKTIKDWLKIYDKLVNQNPPHSSPLEHCCKTLSEDEYNSFIKSTPETESFKEANGWCGPYKGFKSHRYIIENKWN